jgi:hypothetical protein
MASWLDFSIHPGPPPNTVGFVVFSWTLRFIVPSEMLNTNRDLLNTRLELIFASRFSHINGSTPAIARDILSIQGSFFISGCAN